ncbi:hypothetical protein KM043_004211 [Ampulex compressa]|nr:hypothetical protein KM043_004211 [Ampulex compressa]
MKDAKRANAESCSPGGAGLNLAVGRKNGHRSEPKLCVRKEHTAVDAREALRTSAEVFDATCYINTSARPASGCGQLIYAVMGHEDEPRPSARGRNAWRAFGESSSARAGSLSTNSI